MKLLLPLLLAIAPLACVDPAAPPADGVVAPEKADAAGSDLIAKANAAIDDVAVDFQVGIPPSTIDAATMELTEDGDATPDVVARRLGDTAAALAHYQDKDEKLKPLVDALNTLKDRLPSLSADQRWLANEAAGRGTELAKGLETAPPRVKDEPVSDELAPESLP